MFCHRSVFGLVGHRWVRFSSSSWMRSYCCCGCCCCEHFVRLGCLFHHGHHGWIVAGSWIGSWSDGWSFARSSAWRNAGGNLWPSDLGRHNQTGSFCESTTHVLPKGHCLNFSEFAEDFRRNLCIFVVARRWPGATVDCIRVQGVGLVADVFE